MAFIVKPGVTNQTVTIALPEIALLATVSGPESAVAGSVVQIEWTGPGDKNDFIAVAPPDSRDGVRSEFSYIRDSAGILNLRMPPEGGIFELRYVLGKGHRVIARHQIKVTPVVATITPPAELLAGATVAVEWTGPDYKNDYISVVEPGEDKWINYIYTRDGSPVGLQMPGEPGDYEIIYMLGQQRTVIARIPVKVTGVEYALSAPQTATGGSSIEVSWVGPDYKNDYVSVAEEGADDSKYVHYSYTRDGTPVVLQVPLTAGSYEIRYVLSQDRVVKARVPLEVTAVTGGISGPESANAGARVEVNWKGPGYKNDYISIASPDQDTTKYEGYTYTRDGTPLLLQMPTKPGDYELRYIAAGSDAKVLARQPITVNPVSATLEVNGTAAPGSNLVVTWTGPDYRNDFVAISRADDPKGYETYTYTRDGSPMILKVPERPGVYQVRYFMGQDRVILERSDLTVK